MKNSLTKKLIEKYSRQIVLKDIGISGQRKIINSKILIVGAGGLGCPVADYLSRAGVGFLGIADHDQVNLSNIHRQSLYDSTDVGKFKIEAIKNKIKKINPSVRLKLFKKKINKDNIKNIIKNFDIIVDGSDNFQTKFLLNKFSIKFEKKLVVGAISKFDGHIFSFDFKIKKMPCLKCFYQSDPSDEILDCESEGIMGPLAGIIGSIQSMQVLKLILNMKNDIFGKILIMDFKSLNFKKIKFSKKINCICTK